MRVTPLTVLVVALVLLCGLPAARAYTTTEAVRTFTSGVMAFELAQTPTDVCTSVDPGSHIAMPTSASIQSRIQETAVNGGVTANIPLGGGTMQATCTDNKCEWKWTRGFYYFSWPTFYQGVYYTGPSSSAAASPTDKTLAVAGSYTNWDTNYPVSWSNLSYWGKRLVAMQPSSGKWRNVEVSTRYTQLVCEHFVYTNSDGANGIIPTFPGGSGIPLVSSAGHVYSYCGHDISKDSQGRWLLPKCGNAFPWWAGLVIAVVCYIILVALIIIIWCCCCVARSNKEEKRRRQIIGTEQDNTGHIPNQSELGLSRESSRRSQRSSADYSGASYSDDGSSSEGNGASFKSGSGASSATDSDASSGSSSRSSSRSFSSRE